MKEYESIINQYVEYQSVLSNTLTKAEWGDKTIAEKYLSKYWLLSIEYESKWKLVQNQIFICDEKWVPNPFPVNFETIVKAGGWLFDENDFLRLQKCVLDIGDKYIFIIENVFDGEIQEPAFRMKFPATVSWDEFISGNFVSVAMNEHIMKEFFVFSESGKFGRYTYKYGSDIFQYPFDFTWYKSENSKIFNGNFIITDLDKEMISKYIPAEYRGLINEGAV